MLSFIGDYTCKLDSKGRGVVPAVFRKEMQAAGRGVVCDAAEYFR